jgi:Flp pilus assembly protein TadD
VSATTALGRSDSARAARLARVSPDIGAAFFGLAFVGLLGADSGGYWPTTWSWTALVALVVVAVLAVASSSVVLGRFELAFLGLLFAVLLWTSLSSVWSAAATASVPEAERTLVYVSLVVAALLLLRESNYRALLGGIWAATVLVCFYGLMTRLLPDRIGVIDSTALNRLSSPIGYWNALGIFAVSGTLLAVGFSAQARSVAVRALAGGSLLVLVPTLYFTFSRGPWIAAVIGLAAMIAVEPRRLQLVTVLGLLAPWVAAGVWLASRSTELTRTVMRFHAAAPQGHRLAWILVLLFVGAVVTSLSVALVERRVSVPREVRRGYVLALSALAIAALAAVFVQYGSPWSLAQRGYHDFQSRSGGITSNSASLNQRFLTFSGNGRVDLWRVAWHDARAHPWLGSGAGTYERYWNRYRPFAGHVLDAHSLYMETFAELGAIGLGLLIAAFVVPLLAATRVRRQPLATAAFGAFLAYAIHAGVDWDWEVPAATLAPLLCAAVLVALARGRGVELRRAARVALPAAALALAVFAFIGLRANRAIASAEAAANKADWTKAVAEARQARSWAPWSAQPWQLLGEAQLRQGRFAAARASLRKALDKDDGDWNTWLDLALASRGAERGRALAQATRLDPLDPELAIYRSELGKR